MREIAMGQSGAGELMTGPDGVVYDVSKGSRAVHSAPGNNGRGPAIPAGSTGIPIPEAVSIHNDLRAKLGNLPQMPVIPC